MANLVYTVHCYDPFIFTHQGATWSSEQYKVMRDLPFPSSPAAVAPVLSQIPEQFRPEAEKYGSKLYDAAYLRKRLQRAADWGVQNHVPVVLGEFGCYPPSCPPASRENWFAAMRDAATAVKMPTCLWAYDDALGLGRKLTPDGRVQLDPVTLRVLYGL